MSKGHGSNSRDFYRSFCRWSLDANSAAASVAAGCIGGGILSATMVSAGILGLFITSPSSPHPLALFAIAACSGLAVYATWRRVVSGAVVNAAFGLAVTVWLCTRGEVAIAVMIFVPLVCGPVTAASVLIQ